MGANRKLQIEIDRTLKKVAEGIEVFDEIWEKVYETDQIPLKEKYELDLKKEIKKLQRYRDTIKTWISGSDIKDKTALVEARKSVERQMERFKVCEKETKTKTFSKEGLAQAQKQDPKERARNDIRDWINTTVDTFTTEAENFDAEVESLQTNKKKGKPPPRLVHAEESAVRHRAHINRLEQILRLLDNEAIEPEDVNESKEMVEDYMQRNQDDFDDFAEPDDLYADLIEQLDNLESQQPAAVNHIGKSSGLKDKDHKEREKEREKERSAALAMKMQLAQGGHNVVIEDSSPEKPPPPPAPRKVPEIRPPPPAPSRGAQTTRESRDIDAGSESQPSVADSAPSTPLRRPPHNPRADPPAIPAQQLSEELRQPPPPPPPPPVVSAPAPTAPAPSPLPSLATTSFAAAAAAASTAPQSPLRTAPIDVPLQVPPQYLVSQQEAAPDSLNSGTAILTQGRAIGFQFPAEPTPNSQASSINGPPVSRAPPGGVIALSTGWPTAVETVHTDSSNSIKDSSSRQEDVIKVNRMPQSSTMAEIVEAGDPELPPVPSPGYSLRQLNALSAAMARFMPTAADRLWTAPHLSSLMKTGLPHSYPDTKLPRLEDPRFFEELDIEALFFAFYYQPETLQQYLAARDLKRQSWRFHKQHGTWFQRHEEPTLANEEFEMGTYVYFDYNISHDETLGWCYRLKQDFTFRYDALEDELI